MNESGRAVLSLLTANRVHPQQMLAVFDDADLPFGRLRLRTSGGSGGHNGIKSIIDSAGEGFNRLRIGIGRSGESQRGLTGHVLSRFSNDEEAGLPAVIENAACAIETFVQRGMRAAMDAFNRKQDQ